MQCENFRVMLDNYADLTDEEKARLDEHAEHCPECKAELDFLLSVIDAVNTLPKIEPPSDFLDKLNKRIDAEEKKNNGIWAALKRNCRTYSGLAACLLLVAVIAPNGQTLGDKMMYPDDGALVSYSVTTNGNNKANKSGAAGGAPSDKAAPTTQPSFGPRATEAPQTGLFGLLRPNGAPSGAASSGAASSDADPFGTAQARPTTAPGNQTSQAGGTRIGSPASSAGGSAANTPSSGGAAAPRPSFGGTAGTSFTDAPAPSLRQPGANATTGAQTNRQTQPQGASSNTEAAKPQPASADGNKANPSATSQPKGYSGNTADDKTEINANTADDKTGPLRINDPGKIEDEDYGANTKPTTPPKENSGSRAGGGSSSSGSGGGSQSGGSSKPDPTKSPTHNDSAGGQNVPSAPTEKPDYSGGSPVESVPTAAPRPTRRPSGGSGSGSSGGDIPEGAPPAAQEATPKPTRFPNKAGAGHDSDPDSDVSGDDIPSAPAPGPPGGAADKAEGSAEIQIIYVDFSQVESARDILSSYAVSVLGNNVYAISADDFSAALNEIRSISEDIGSEIYTDGDVLIVTLTYTKAESDPDENGDPAGGGKDPNDTELSSDKTETDEDSNAGGGADTDDDTDKNEDTDPEDNTDTNEDTGSDDDTDKNDYTGSDDDTDTNEDTGSEDNTDTNDNAESNEDADPNEDTGSDEDTDCHENAVNTTETSE